MFRIDREKNVLQRLKKKRFADLKLSERAHLQEWIANQPGALGEDLLILQKEFDGFAETRERLDLLALDKEGRLVVIENKLDDSGRDVVWQALKYAAYCSSLTKADILTIYQSFLDRSGNDNALERICEFLERDDLDEVVLNAGNDQRVILVAATFRKEVTSTALWLLNHGVNLHCIKVTPYAYEDEIFLDIQPIIPPPEAKEFMIDMGHKETTEKTVQAAQSQRHRLRLEFWQLALETLRTNGVDRYRTVNPTKDHWLSSSTGLSGCVYNLIFSKKETRVELSLQRAEQSENKWLFDKLAEQQADIEARFGANLDWRRMPDRISSRIVYAKACDGFDKDNWPEMIQWLEENIVHLETAFDAPLNTLGSALKSGLV